MQDEEYIKEVAAQLRKPSGELGTQIAEMMNTGNLMMNQNTIKALEVKSNDQILEIGMGNGFFVKDILSKAEGVNYTGCDYSAEMVEVSEKVNQAFINSGSAMFHEANAEKLPLNNNSIDTIFTVNTLYFWKDQTSVLNEFKRVLKPDGKLVLAIRPAEVMALYPPTKYGFNFFSENEACTLLIGHGFEIVDSTEFEEPLIERNGKQFPPKHLIIKATL